MDLEAFICHHRKGKITKKSNLPRAKDDHVREDVGPGTACVWGKTVLSKQNNEPKLCHHVQLLRTQVLRKNFELVSPCFSALSVKFFFGLSFLLIQQLFLTFGFLLCILEAFSWAVQVIFLCLGCAHLHLFFASLGNTQERFNNIGCCLHTVRSKLFFCVPLHNPGISPCAFRDELRVPGKDVCCLKTTFDDAACEGSRFNVQRQAEKCLAHG
eukprot:c11065_g1_i1.p1 GENE.c11065_g1_i1~~c11065_g1_i1.p1  ORF type:complete len:213 (+),score=7.70 c11065_g1_i1:18-656(+)